MAPSQPAGNRQFMRLRDEFRDTFSWKRVTREGFRGWARQVRESPINVSVYHWKPLRDGEPVAMEVMEAFSEFIATRGHPAKESRLSVIAEHCELPAKQKPKASRLRLTWEIGWHGLLVQLFDTIGIEDDAFCANEADLLAAAQMVHECMGWHDKRLTGREAIAYGEKQMNRSSSGYARLLLQAWQANEYSVLFVTLRDVGRPTRFGVHVTLPVTRSFYERFRDGKANEFEMTPEDYEPQSNFMLAHAFAENVAIDLKRGKVARSMATSRTAVYQLAAVCLPITTASQPHIITIAGTVENAKRLKAYGFAMTGATHPESGKQVMEFAPPAPQLSGLARFNSIKSYVSMRSLMEIFQAYIAAKQLPAE